MFRKTLTIVCLIGLLLNVALWGMSYWNVRALFTRSAEGVTIDLMQGCLGFNYEAYVGVPRQRSNRLVVGGFSGFDTIWIPPYFSAGRLPRYPSLLIYVPVNLLALVFLVLSGYLLAPTHRRRKRKKLGLCIKCGYDLRGSKERCPECGTEFGSAGLDELRDHTLPAKYE